jgi:hypothetical protein
MSIYPHIAAAGPDMAEPSQIPREVDRWNWGAFFLSWIWGLGNGTPIALLTLVPLVGFVMIFVLGAKGSRWAWHNERWDSVEHFKRVQRKWAIAGLIVWIVGIAGVAFLVPSMIETYEIVSMGTSQIMDHPAHKLGLAQLQGSPLTTSVLGTPITDGTSGKLSLHSETKSLPAENKNLGGNATLSFPVRGPKGSGTAFVEATEKDGVWSLTRLSLKPDGSDNEIIIVGGRAPNN